MKNDMINMMELKERLRFANKEELYYDFKSSFAPITSLHIALKIIISRKCLQGSSFFFNLKQFIIHGFRDAFPAPKLYACC